MRKAFYMIFAAVMMCSCGIYTKYEPQTSVPDNLYGDSLSYGTDTEVLAMYIGVNYLRIHCCRI